jgi:uncharacterized membrane protein YccF (DUF307 family)
MIIISLVIICLLFWACFRFAGLMLKIAYVVLIGIPLAGLICSVGIAMCCTLILLPIGRNAFGLASRAVYPF